MTLASERMAGAIRSDLTAPGARRRAQAAAALDRWLGQMWQAALEATGTAPDGLALAAVGGHARRDSGPAGDLDLILLHRDPVDPSTLTEFAQRLWYPIWDEGFRLDHALRSPASARLVARRDLAVATGLLDLRSIAGDVGMVDATRGQLLNDWRGSARRRLPELTMQVKERSARSGDLADLLEPDLKDARGGLRDAALIDATVATWLADASHDWQGCRDRLCDIRDALQAVAGRPTHRLILAEQDAVAAVLGLADADDLLIEVSRCGRHIGHVLETTLRAATRSAARRTGLRQLTAPRLQPVAPGVAIHEGEVVLAAPEGHRDVDPGLPLRAAAAAARSGAALSPTSAAALGRMSKAHPLPTPWPDTALALLLDVLAAGDTLPALWQTLDHVGLVDGWLPQWRQIRSRPQRNAVHRFTVDRHSIQACVEAAALGPASPGPTSC